MHGRRTQALAALAIYSAAAFLILGLAVARASGSWLVGIGGDSEIFVWAFAWWPHAISHGIDPLTTHAVWSPVSIDLAWVTSVPGAALVAWPLTALYGPVAAYDAVMVATPALAAFAAFLLARELSGRFWPSLAGGWAFGFSSYLLGQSLGHLHAALVFPIPLIALALLRHVRGELSDRGLTWRVGVLMALLVSFSTELALTTLLASLATAVVARLTLGSAIEPALRRLLRPLAWAVGVTAVLASPLVIAALAGFETTRINSPNQFSADAVNLVVPTRITLAGGDWLLPISRRFRGNLAENGTYLGLPLLALCLLEARETWARRTARIAPICLAVAIVCALGPLLRICGVPVLPLPWLPLAFTPGFDDILPVRLMLFAALAGGLLVAAYLARRATPARIALALAALAAPFPALGAGIWRSPAPVLRSAAIAQVVHRGDVALVLPFGGLGHGMLWQATTDFRFRQAGGYLRPDPPDRYRNDPAVEALRDAKTPAPGDLRHFLDKSGTDVVLVDPGYAAQADAALGPLGFKPERADGLIVYRVTSRPGS